MKGIIIELAEKKATGSRIFLRNQNHVFDGGKLAFSSKIKYICLSLLIPNGILGDMLLNVGAITFMIQLL